MAFEGICSAWMGENYTYRSVQYPLYFMQQYRIFFRLRNPGNNYKMCI